MYESFFCDDLFLCLLSFLFIIPPLAPPASNSGSFPSQSHIQQVVPPPEDANKNANSDYSDEESEEDILLSKHGQLLLNCLHVRHVYYTLSHCLVSCTWPVTTDNVLLYSSELVHSPTNECPKTGLMA